MEPLKLSDLEKARNLGATEQQIAEYNRLVAQRFNTNPYLAKSPEDKEMAKDREQRIGDLYQQLFSAVRLDRAG
jgi:hypothetical protein